MNVNVVGNAVNIPANAAMNVGTILAYVAPNAITHSAVVAPRVAIIHVHASIYARNVGTIPAYVVPNAINTHANVLPSPMIATALSALFAVGSYKTVFKQEALYHVLFAKVQNVPIAGNGTVRRFMRTAMKFRTHRLSKTQRKQHTTLCSMLNRMESRVKRSPIF